MNASRHRVLQVITDNDRRGAQVFATDLHDALVRRGRSVRTVALAPGATGGLDVPLLGRRRLGVSTLRSLRREMRSAEVVIAHGSTTLPACALAGIGTGVPFVYRQIGDQRFWAPHGLRRWRVRLALRRSTKVVALWSGAADTLVDYLGVARERIAVIPNGAPAERFPLVDREAADDARHAFGLAPERPTLAYVGALDPGKGVHLAIDALQQLETAQLLIAGDGPERQRLEEQANQVAPGQVVFAGVLSDVSRALRAADAVVFPSLGADSMPAVLIEAGLAGLPSVATHVGAIPTIVLDGKTGFVVDAGSAAALADAARSALEPARSRALGADAHKYCIEHFEIGVVAAQWDSVLTQVLLRPGG